MSFDLRIATIINGAIINNTLILHSSLLNLTYLMFRSVVNRGGVCVCRLVKDRVRVDRGVKAVAVTNKERRRKVFIGDDERVSSAFRRGERLGWLTHDKGQDLRIGQ